MATVVGMGYGHFFAAGGDVPAIQTATTAAAAFDR